MGRTLASGRRAPGGAATPTTEDGTVRVVVAGEALVDLVPDAAGHLRPLPGGSPLNVAVGLGRLGMPTGYLGVLSRDAFGDLLAARLADAGVATVLPGRSGVPTSLAMVHLDAVGVASYSFYLDGTSAVGLRTEDVAALPAEVAAAPLHVSLGAVTLATPGTGTTLVGLLADASRRRFTSLDPNVRPAVIPDLAAARAALDAAAAVVDLVKVSDEDLAVLAPRTDPLEAARRWAADGTLVVVTRGADGAVALRGDDVLAEVASPRVPVVDTVGAGDAFTSGLLATLDAGGLLDRGMLARADGGTIAVALRAAARVAAITCTRPGADPPRRDELTEVTDA
jgi:fructokinase